MFSNGHCNCLDRIDLIVEIARRSFQQTWTHIYTECCGTVLGFIIATDTCNPYWIICFQLFRKIYTCIQAVGIHSKRDASSVQLNYFVSVFFFKFFIKFEISTSYRYLLHIIAKHYAFVYVLIWMDIQRNRTMLKFFHLRIKNFLTTFINNNIINNQINLYIGHLGLISFGNLVCSKMSFIMPETIKQISKKTETLNTLGIDRT